MIKQIVLNGNTFQYLELGKRSAPPIIALHALGKSSESWSQVAAELGKEYRVIALDQRGHGGSERTGVYSFELMCDDLLQFVNALSIKQFTLVGHSMGGTVSYLFSEKYPSMIDRLIIEDTPPPFPDKQIDIPPEPVESLPFDWQVVPSILRQLNDPNPQWWDRFNDITAPTLLIGGGTTSHVPQDKLYEVSERIPNCKLVTIEGAGHHVHETSVTPYLEAVKSFLKQ